MAFAIVSCDPELTNAPGSGSLGTLTPQGEQVRYVALGNSLIAGFVSGALFESGQQYSIPNIIAQQLGITDFQQPLIAEPGIGVSKVTLEGFGADGRPVLRTDTVLSLPMNFLLDRAYHNLGVPGMFTAELLDTTEYAQRANDLHALIGRDSRFGRTYIDQAASHDPHLMTVWIGENDALFYAILGGVSPTFPAPTDAVVFDATLQQIFAAINAKMPDTKVMVANLPPFTCIPFFTTIPWNALTLDQASADALNQVSAYQQLGFAFNAGPNGFVVESSTSPGGIRQLQEGEFVLLTTPQDSLAAGWGAQKPIPDGFVLDSDEVALVKAALDAYNISIRNVVDTYANVFLFDAVAMFEQLDTRGYQVTGSTPFTSAFISGGFFSLDGVHPSRRGYAIAANEMIRLLNQLFDASIAFTSVNAVPGIPVETGG